MVLVRDPESSDDAKLYPFQSVRHPSRIDAALSSAAAKRGAAASKTAASNTAALPPPPPRRRATSAAGDWVRRNLASMQGRGSGLSALNKVGAIDGEEINAVGNSAFVRRKPPPPPALPDPSVYLRDLELSDNECYNQSCVRAPALYVTDGEGIIPGVLELTLDMVSFKPDDVPLVRELGADRFSWALEMIDLLPPRTQVDAPSFEQQRRLLPEGPFHREDPQAQEVAAKAAAGGTFHHSGQDAAGSAGREHARNEGDAPRDATLHETDEAEGKAAAKADANEWGDDNLVAAAAAQHVRASAEASATFETSVPTTPLSPHGTLGTGPVRRVRRPSENLEEQDYPYYLELRLQLIFGRRPTAKTTASYWLALSRGRIDAVYDFLEAHCSAAQMNKEWEVVDTLDMCVAQR
jgi:hypothetical protein